MAFSTEEMVATVVTYLVGKLKSNKSLNDFFSDFTDASVKWIRPLFLKDENTYEKIIEDLLKNPDSAIKVTQIKTAIQSNLEDEPSNISQLQEMFDKIKTVQGSTLEVRSLKGKAGVEVESEQEGSSAKLSDIESEEGKVTLKIKQK